MTTVRPLYRFSVTNVDQGWTYTVTHRDPAPELPDVTVLLTDDLVMGWGFSNDQVPGALDPDTCSFKLYVSDAEHLPAIEPGDIITANLDRPGPGVGELIPYMHFAGRASDPELDVSPTGGIYMSVQSTGVFEDLSANVLWEDPPGYEVVEDGALVEDQMMRAIYEYTLNGTYLFKLDRPFSRHAYLTGDGMKLSDFIDRMTASLIVPPSTEFYALRNTWGFYPGAYPFPPDPASWYDAFANFPEVGSPRRPVGYYYEGAPLVLPPAMELTEDDTDPDMVVLVPTEEGGDVTVVSARHVRSPTGLRKTRADIVNDIDISGVDTSGTTNKEVRKRYRNAASVARYGQSTRTVETTAVYTGLPAIADGYLHGPESVEWSVPELVVTTGNMDDAELDQLAPVFYPHPPQLYDYWGKLGRFLILADLPDRIAIGDSSALATQLVGATFRVSKGDITITARVRALPPADFTTAITFDELAASPLGDATFVDTGTGHYIDPALDIDELIYTDI